MRPKRMIDRHSVCIQPIEMLFGPVRLSFGTAFLWKDDAGQFYLVTNWHNFTGINPSTGKHLSATGGEPDIVRVWWNEKGFLGAKVAEDIPLRDSKGQPLWLAHPSLGNKVDVVALPVSPPTHADVYPINEPADTPLAFRVGMDVFVLGFPLGFYDGLPIWKRGSVASEPQMTNSDHLYFLVDTASRPGMSGSPVIRRSWSTHLMEDGGISMGPQDASRFVGVYSGRLTAADPLDAQLGMVWPVPLLVEIVEGKKRDS